MSFAAGGATLLVLFLLEGYHGRPPPLEGVVRVSVYDRTPAFAAIFFFSCWFLTSCFLFLSPRISLKARHVRKDTTKTLSATIS